MKATHVHDGELIAAFGASRNETAFRELVRRHAPMVFRTCRRITGNDPDAEDAAQQVFATLVVQARNLASSRSLAGWLYETAWHVSMRVRRAQGVRRRHEPRALRPGPSDLNGMPDEELLHELYRAIEMLPPPYREAVVLHHLSGLTVEQVSELMACNVGTTAARLSRARAMLRERLRWREVIIPVAALDALLSGERADGDIEYDVRDWTTMTPPQWSAAGGAGGTAAGTVTTAIHRASPYSLGGGASTAAASGTIGASNWAMAACVAAAVIATPLAAGQFARIGGFGYSGGRGQTQHTSGSGSASQESTFAGYRESPPAVESRSSASSSAVPEPSGVSALAVAAALALQRRSRRATHARR